MDCISCQFALSSFSVQDRDDPQFRESLEHLIFCPSCAGTFADMRRFDQCVGAVVRDVRLPAGLEQKIVVGLGHAGALAASRRSRRWWLAAAATVLVCTSGWYVEWQRIHRPMYRVASASVSLVRQRPPLDMTDTERSRLLEWASGQLGKPLTLGPELNHVQFRGVARVRLLGHPAAMLPMKNERRASLVVVPGRPIPVRLHRLAVFSLAQDSVAVWSDGAQTYALVFAGDQQQLRNYMQRMEIQPS